MVIAPKPGRIAGHEDREASRKGFERVGILLDLPHLETAEEWHRRQAVVLLPNGLKESFLETNRSQVLRMMHAHIRKLEADANVALGDALPSRKAMLDHALRRWSCSLSCRCSERRGKR